MSAECFGEKKNRDSATIFRASSIVSNYNVRIFLSVRIRSFPDRSRRSVLKRMRSEHAFAISAVIVFVLRTAVRILYYCCSVFRRRAYERVCLSAERITHSQTHVVVFSCETRFLAQKVIEKSRANNTNEFSYHVESDHRPDSVVFFIRVL